MRSQRNPYGAKAKQLCLEDANGQVANEIICAKVMYRAERRSYDETIALVPSRLQGYAAIDRVSCGFIVVRIIRLIIG